MKRYAAILRYLVPYWPKVALNVLFNFLSVLFSLFGLALVIPFLGILFRTQEPVTELMPLAFSTDVLINNFYYYITLFIERYSEVHALILVSGMVVVMTLFKTGFKYLAMYQLAAIRNHAVRDIRNTLYRKAVDLPLSYYNNERKGDLISRMTNDVFVIEWSIISSLEMMFRDPITIMVYLIGLTIASPQLTLLVIVLLPISAFIIGRVGRSLRTSSMKGQKKMGFILSVLDETLGGLRVIKAFNSEERMKQRFHSINNLYTRLMVRIFRRQYLATPLSEFLGTFVVVIIMWYGGSLVLGAKSTLSPEEFIGYLLVFSQIINPAKSFSTAWYNVQKGMASAERVQDINNADLVIVEKAEPVSINSFTDRVEFRGVSFRYEKEPVLKNINLIIKKGSTVALVGQSGAGKSTLVDLLPRFFDPQEGVILVDGIPIKDLRIKDLRNLMGFVNQEPILFNDTFFNNIAFGVENTTDQQVEEAARIANAHEFILHTANGYFTNIGDRGGKLSGGQRQRISIARAILKNPPILILDEATSSLDTESERLVQDAVARVMENRTSIVIAHRLSTVVNADLICVMHEGEIIETGTHHELIRKKGNYAKLHKMQMFQ